MSDNKILLKLTRQKYTYVSGVNINNFNKPELQQLTVRLRKYFKGQNLIFSSDSEKSTIALYRRLCDTTVPWSAFKKNDFIEILSAFASDFNNIINTATVAAPLYLKAWKLIVNSVDVPLSHIQDVVKEKILFVSTTSWHSNYIPDPLLFGLFIESVGYTWSKTTANDLIGYLSNSFRSKIAPLIMGHDAINPVVYEELPENHEHPEDFEQAATTDYVFLEALASSSSLLGNNSNISFAKIKATAKKLLENEFVDFPDSTPLSRNLLLVNAYIHMLSYRTSKYIQRALTFLTSQNSLSTISAQC